MGQSYIPRNNMLYSLHQGEAILSRRDADKWRQGKNTSPQINITMNGTIIRKQQDITGIAEELVRKLNQQRIIIG